MEKVLKELKQFMEDNGISQNKIAGMLPFSPATLLALMKGTYKSKDPNLKDKHLQAIQELLEKERERMEDEIGRAIIPFYPTINYRIFKEVATLCHKYLEIGVVTGIQGLGKTRSAYKYYLDNQGTIFISVRPSFSTKILIKKLYEHLGGSKTVCLDDMVEFIIQKMKKSKRLIIFDQMEYSSDKAIDIVRTIYDECLDENGNGTIGIVFTGLPELIYRLKQFPQLHQRINWYRKLGVLNQANEIVKGMTDDDVKAFVRSVFPTVNGEEKIFNELTSANPRVLKKLLDRSLRLCEMNKCKLSKEIIEEAHHTIQAA